MAKITDLPVEIVDQILTEISVDQKATLANLSQTCRFLYHQVIPSLYRTYELRFFGRASWHSRTDILERLIVPGSYEIPDYLRNASDENELDDLYDPKGKGVAGRPQFSRGRSLNLTNRKDSGRGSSKQAKKQAERKLPLMYIRELVICGYWNHLREEHSDEYVTANDGDIREYSPFIEALEAFLWSLERLESFTWKITRPLPPQISASVSRFEDLNTIVIFGDTHMYASQSTYPHVPTPITNNPISFSNNKLVTIKALQVGDYQQVIQYGDVIRSGTNWSTIRNLEFEVSPGFISILIEVEPMEPDILAGLFRPPPPARGHLKTPKMKLHQLKLRDVAFQIKGIDALTNAIDAHELRDLDLYYCQEGADILRRWENNQMMNLERIHIKEELALPHMCKFLRQFGPEGSCRNLKILELCCWHVDAMPYENHHPSLSMYNSYEDNDEDMWDDDDDLSESALSDETSSQSQYPPPALVTNRSKYPLPQPFRSIRDLRGNRKEGWGLKRLVLDMRPGMPAASTRQLPQQEIFFEAFWRLKELAIPVSYETNSCWGQFVDTVAKLPNLEYLFLLNARTEARSGSNYVSFSIYQPAFTTQRSDRPPQHTRGVKRKQKEKEIEPDMCYVDALSIASKNRLRIHSNGIEDNDPSSSSTASSQLAWRGKLRYIGIRRRYPIGIRQPVRVWKVIVSDVPKKKAIPEGSAERRQSLRSSKRRKAENCDWRLVEDGNQYCRLDEVDDDSEKAVIGGGIFNGMQRYISGDQ